MYLEGITVSVGYADFLSDTLQRNISLFDKFLVVTAPDDSQTQRLCHHLSVPCLLTNDFTRDGQPFNKGRAIQRAFNNIEGREWILHLDADIVLPPRLRTYLAAADLDQEKIYGCDRMMVPSWDAWQRIQQGGYVQQGSHAYILPHEKYPIGARWASPTDGYVPIGFFQLFHREGIFKKGTGIFKRPYVSHHGDASRADVQFGLQWDRRQRELLPELLVWHLGTPIQVNNVGLNWKGRVSGPWGPPSTSKIECPS